ncbi:hypothetical protein HBO32_31710 [Pseudomonas nitroreducens]|uniref:hypothetical protein n=1 Tax=Pseudomonas nitroreducens TaxID=46680 RepID=UPI0014751F7A|nr:hypothetical protein [Pseudomonas nitroreducens]NMZ77668.1 hypothetical protein [Pseudomonas nitroreducens]
MYEYVLALWIEGNKAEPVLTASGYPTEESCLMAGDLMKAADIAAKKAEKRYSIICQEVEKPQE